MAMKPVSRSVPTLLGKMFERKYIALGRIVTYWKEIVGADFADRAQPAKIHYRKPKAAKEKPTATLDIAAASADCAVMVYQKDVILQRINQIFGDSWITDIRFVHYEPQRPSKPLKQRVPLNTEEQGRLSQILATVDDPDIKERLARLGQSILQDTKR